MEVKKDEGGPWSSTGASPASSNHGCYRSAIVASFVFVLIVGVFVGLLISESSGMHMQRDT